jgi:hypothetical protein
LYQALQSLFKNYSPLLNHFGITEKSLEVLAKLNGHDEQIKSAWQWIQLHYFLSGHASTSVLHLTDIQNYYRSSKKKLKISTTSV